MVYILWSVINIVIFIYFFKVCLKGATLIRERLGGLPLFILVFGLSSFMSASSKEANESEKWSFREANQLEAKAPIFQLSQ